ncbi:MAG: LysR substrate-binding domain-containing protein, partial [Dongiaceae bacterium]
MSSNNTLTATERLDSDLLRTFLIVAEAGSVTKGGDRLLRTQSATSLQIKRLETQIGQQVFERHGRGVRLTAIGEKLLPAAQRVVSLLDATAADLKSDRLTGSLRIGIPDEHGATILPTVLARFASRYADVEVNVRCGFSVEFPKALRQGELDLAVYAAEQPGSSIRLLVREKTVWATSRDHAAHERDPLPVALFDRDCWWRQQAIAALEEAGRRYRIVYTSESVAGVMAAIASGIAVGVLAENSMSAAMRRLGKREGLPTLPSSSLV